jgi:arsenate reductase
MMAGDIARHLDIGASTLSAHLSKLRRGGLIGVHRKGTSLHYALDADGTAKLIAYLTDDCCGGQSELCGITTKPAVPTPTKPATLAKSPSQKVAPIPTTKPAKLSPDKSGKLNVLFLCTGNSARSILAECLLNRIGGAKFHAFSAGSKPAGKVHPAAKALLEDHGYAVSPLASKSWDEFRGSKAPKLSIVITVCGNAAGETCPVWNGAPVRAHWGLNDPAAIKGSKAKITNAFEQTYSHLEDRIYALMDLHLAEMNSKEVRQALVTIGQMEGSA